MSLTSILTAGYKNHKSLEKQLGTLFVVGKELDYNQSHQTNVETYTRIVIEE